MDFTQAERDIVEIKHQDLWNGGYVKKFDFSKANSSEAHRIHAITMIANVCRGDKGIKDKEALYKQLLTEHDGKPGEVFQFVPIQTQLSICNIIEGRFGYFNPKEQYWNLYTNLRANLSDKFPEHKELYNKQVFGFHVFKIKIPMMIVQHILRHGQLSFMQVSERSQKLREYYYCDDFKTMFEDMLCGYHPINRKQAMFMWNEYVYKLSQYELDEYQCRFKIRQELTNKGSHGLAYVTMWLSAWQQDPSTWDNFFAVRTKNPSQKEIQELATVMKGMIDEI